MNILRTILLFLGLVFVAGASFAVPSVMHGETEQSVNVGRVDYGLDEFYCNGRLYRSDIPLKNFQGCETQDISYGPQGLDAKLMTVFYDWQEGLDVKVAKRATFIEKPNGDLYRLKSTKFLESLQLQTFFEDSYGRGRANLGSTNLNVSDYSVRNIQSFGNTFCVTHFMKFPFRGTMGWCQGDHVVGGDVGYLDGVMTYSRAAILAQSEAYAKNLKFRKNRLFHEETRVVLKKDPHGYMYWGFGVPSAKVGKLSAYGLRVYFNGQVFVNEYPSMPTLEEL